MQNHISGTKIKTKPKNQPNQILSSSSSFIDLLFTSHPNLVMEAGVHSSLHLKCHDRMIYANFNIKIYYPPIFKQHLRTISTKVIRLEDYSVKLQFTKLLLYHILTTVASHLIKVK